MSKFWQKQYISKYTGAEIDAAVAAGSQVPEIDIEDAGKILAVDAEGKIVAKTDPVPVVTADNNGKVLKVSNGQWAIGEDAIGSIVTPDNNDFIQKFTITTDGVSQDCPVTYLEEILKILSFNSDETVTLSGKVIVGQNSVDASRVITSVINKPYTSFLPTQTEAYNLVTTGTATRTVILDREGNAIDYIDADIPFVIWTDTFRIPCFLSSLTNTKLSIHGSFSVVTGESAVFTTQGSYVITGSIEQTADHTLQIIVNLTTL